MGKKVAELSGGQVFLADDQRSAELEPDSFHEFHGSPEIQNHAVCPFHMTQWREDCSFQAMEKSDRDFRMLLSFLLIIL